ncbi:hypothetical protein GOP47_0004033 [Adiantum capillus-veneris]|uniref:PRONE domain-containing protein n=1 Tax=Adiantum capillus-veneris TaxID=13818 RepID=A0A9D4V6R3_ADICA|nr:hypothetical protein GOP47_0004033 [Adiantum capillus-veneris]
MDGHGPGEDEDDHCLKVVRCSKGYVPTLSHWTLQALRSLTCQSSLVKRRNPSFQGKKILSPAASVVPLLHRSFSRGLLSSGHARLKPGSVKCISTLCPDRKMRDANVNPAGRLEAPYQASSSQGTDDLKFSFESMNTDFESMSTDTHSLSSRVSSNNCDHKKIGVNSSDGFSLSSEASQRDSCCQLKALADITKPASNSFVAFWEDNEERKEKHVSELDVMKERFAKLLLGEDMSGGAKGVCTALAISNAITNLSASIFGELWRLEPLSLERKVIWKREMDWLLSVADHIVELVPSWQKFADGSSIEVMTSKPRADVHTNLPALQKLDAMLLGFLDSCQETEFWYVEQGVVVCDDDAQNINAPITQREEEKWWLPTPKVAATGLSEGGRKSLHHQRECVNQILKAAMEINTQILSEMDIPDVYWDSLPKSGRTSLGETIYRHISSDYFSPEAVLCILDLSTEHNAVEVANRIEAAIHVWRYRKHPKQVQKLRKRGDQSARHTWSIAKENAPDSEKRALLAGRAESLLMCLKQKFPGLRQSLLDMTKIQYNKDVGQSILESYSRVMESLAFNIIARIDDVLFVDDMTKRVLPGQLQAVKTRVHPFVRRGYSLNLSVNTPFATPLDTPSLSPTPTSPQEARGAPLCDKVNAQSNSDKCVVEAGNPGHKLDLGQLTKPEPELNRA